MQYLSKETKREDNKNLYAFIGIVLIFFIVILGIIIYNLIKQNILLNDTVSNYIDVEYDPISGGNYELIDQEQQGDTPNAKYQYLGFGPLYELGLIEDSYTKFIESTNAYVSENFGDIKYVSLLQESLKKDNNIYYFTIYVDSKTPINVTISTNPEFNVTYSTSE